MQGDSKNGQRKMYKCSRWEVGLFWVFRRQNSAKFLRKKRQNLFASLLHCTVLKARQCKTGIRDAKGPDWPCRHSLTRSASDICAVRIPLRKGSCSDSPRDVTHQTYDLFSEFNRKNTMPINRGSKNAPFEHKLVGNHFNP